MCDTLVKKKNKTKELSLRQDAVTLTSSQNLIMVMATKTRSLQNLKWLSWTSLAALLCKVK